MNKITPEKFDKLSQELLDLGLESEDVLTRVLLLIFNKALDDYKYSCMYAKLCKVINDNVSKYYEQNYNKNVCIFHCYSNFYIESDFLIT